MLRYYSLSFSIYLAMQDLLMCVAGIYIAEQVRINVDIGLSSPPDTFATPVWMYLLLPAVWLVVLINNGGYQPQKTYRYYLEAFQIARSTVIFALVISGVLYVIYRDFSRFQAFYLFNLVGLLTIFGRLALRLYFRTSGGRTYDSKRILVVGTDDLGQSISRMIRAYAWTGIYQVGFVTNEKDETDLQEIDNIPVVGADDDLLNMVEDHNIHEVIFAADGTNYDKLNEFSSKLYDRRVNVRFAPDLQELAYLSATIEQIDGLPLITLKEPVLSPIERIMKRAVDIVISFILLTISLPILIIIAIAIRLESKGSPLFFQERVGENMKPFKMIKFRTMVQNAEALQEEVNIVTEDDQVIHKVPNDPRVTGVGSFLRKTSLDELPQLINILIGDMSLVGPRPELPWLVEKYDRWQRKRFEVPQGLTGWWQINGRSEKPMHLATEDDLYYILNYSIWLDLIILARTPFVVLNQRGAF